MQKPGAQKIALERMFRLIELAEQNQAKHPDRSKRYIELITLIGQKNRVRIPLDIKKQFCKKCHSYLKPGKNAKLRTTKTYQVLTCGDCGFARKIRLK